MNKSLVKHSEYLPIQQQCLIIRLINTRCQWVRDARRHMADEDHVGVETLPGKQSKICIANIKSKMYQKDLSLEGCWFITIASLRIGSANIRARICYYIRLESLKNIVECHTLYWLSGMRLKLQRWKIYYVDPVKCNSPLGCLQGIFHRWKFFCFSVSVKKKLPCVTAKQHVLLHCSVHIHTYAWNFRLSSAI